MCALASAFCFTASKRLTTSTFFLILKFALSG
jgi:hypothetical protein